MKLSEEITYTKKFAEIACIKDRDRYNRSTAIKDNDLKF